MSAVSFEDSDVVRSAVRVEGFRDDEFDYQLIRALGVADYGGSTVGECLAVVAEITDGSPASWALAFERLARRVEDRGRACLAPAPGQRPGPPAAGVDLLPDGRVLRRRVDGDADGRESAARPVSPRPPRCVDPPVERSRCPSRGIASGLPGASGRRRPPGRRRGRPPWSAVGGFDSSAEELYFHLGAPGAERGWNVFVFDGPGQPGCMRLNPAMTFRPDYEVPIGAVLDHLTGRLDVDSGSAGPGRPEFRLVLRRPERGHRPRVRALVANPPIVDMGRYMEAWVGTDVYRMTRDIRPEDVIGVPEDLMPRQMQWGIGAICTRFGVPSFHAWRDAMDAYRLGGLVSAIGCPVLALVGDREGAEPRAQFDAFVADVTAR